MGKVAALYVARAGPYAGLADVDVWDETRDARRYVGSSPVVAHPPCQRWGKFYAGSPLVIARTGVRLQLGDDGGCFEHALWAIREFGGVLEHPMASRAWDAFGLNRPPCDGGWVNADFLGGWTCCVEQGRFGHYARKPTWLLAYGCTLPSLPWGLSEWRPSAEQVARRGSEAAARKLGELGFRGGGRDSPVRIATPGPFRDLLLSMARSAAHG